MLAVRLNAGYVENALQRMLFGSQDIAARDKQGIGNRLCQRGVIFLQGINGGVSSYLCGSRFDSCGSA